MELILVLELSTTSASIPWPKLRFAKCLKLQNQWQVTLARSSKVPVASFANLETFIHHAVGFLILTLGQCNSMQCNAAPTYLYGACHEGGRTLDSIRRKLGYFKPNSAGNQWRGSLKTEILELRPDAGPLQPSPAKGIVVIGATNWVDNYNIPVWCSDIDSVRRIASKVRERGGGLKSVQAMALSHAAGCIEVACNLLDPSITGADQVQSEVQRLAAKEGFKVGEGYFTDFSREKITEMYLRCIISRGRG